MNWLQRYYWYHILRGSSYRSLFKPYRGKEFVSLDCETTSLDPKRAELVTIAATKIVDNRILTSSSFEIKLIAPRTLDERSVKIHRMRHQDLSNGISEKEAISQLLHFTDNRPLVGYHISYDKSILDLACLRHFGFPLPNRLIEVGQMYHDQLERLLPNAYFDLSLDAICKHLDLPHSNRHNALQDAIAAALIFVRLTKGEQPSTALFS